MTARLGKQSQCLLYVSIPVPRDNRNHSTRHIVAADVRMNTIL